MDDRTLKDAELLKRKRIKYEGALLKLKMELATHCDHCMEIELNFYARENGRSVEAEKRHVSITREESPGIFDGVFTLVRGAVESELEDIEEQYEAL